MEKVLSQRLRDSLAKVILGKPEAVELLVAAVCAGGHVLIEDAPGTGKTTLAKALALACGLDFHRIQFTPDIMPADITGGAVWIASQSQFQFHAGPIFTNVLLADEINRASPRTQSALLEAMEEHQVTLDGECHLLPAPFLVLATQNPLEFHGVFPLPEAQLDRFMVKISLGYPDAITEKRILFSHQYKEPVQDLVAIMDEETLVLWQEQVRQVFVDDSLGHYIVDLIHALRAHPSIRIPPSPRAGMMLFRMAQSFAFLEGLDHIRPEHIQKAWEPVLSHRIQLRNESNSQKVNVVLAEVLHRIAIPL